MHSKVLIIGAGPAGYTAAVYAARAALEPVMIQGLQPGGQLTITTDVENWPGDIAVMGPDLMERMRAQAEHLGVKLVGDVVTNVDLSRRPFAVTLDGGETWTADTVIIATGASARWLGLPNETKLRGHGVSACATCDGFFFRGKEVAVVGGGNSAVEEAMFLTNFAKRVHLVHRRDGLRADRTNQRRLFENPKVELHWNKAVADVLATDDGMGVRGLALLDTTTGDASELAIDGLFVAIGHDPATSLFRGQLDMDEGGYIRVTPGTTATSIPGVFAAGDVTDPVYRQAITSAGAGCMAALDAERFLAHAHIAEPVVPEAREGRIAEAAE